jgi:hypothetical protein
MAKRIVPRSNARSAREIAAPSLFCLLDLGRQQVEETRKVLTMMRGWIDRSGQGVGIDRSPGEDLHIQLGDALKASDKAILELAPQPWHVDQMLKATA